MTLTGRCLRAGCDWTLTGPAELVDLEARRHTGGSGAPKGGPGHPTEVRLARP